MAFSDCRSNISCLQTPTGSNALLFMCRPQKRQRKTVQIASKRNDLCAGVEDRSAKPAACLPLRPGALQNRERRLCLRWRWLSLPSPRVAQHYLLARCPLPVLKLCASRRIAAESRSTLTACGVPLTQNSPTPPPASPGSISNRSRVRPQQMCKQSGIIQIRLRRPNDTLAKVARPRAAIVAPGRSFPTRRSIVSRSFVVGPRFSRQVSKIQQVAGATGDKPQATEAQRSSRRCWLSHEHRAEESSSGRTENQALRRAAGLGG